MGAIYIKLNAEGRGRTGTVITDRRILSLCVCQFRHPGMGHGFTLAKRKTGFEPATPHLGKVVFYH